MGVRFRTRKEPKSPPEVPHICCGCGKRIWPWQPYYVYSALSHPPDEDVSDKDMLKWLKRLSVQPYEMYHSECGPNRGAEREQTVKKEK